MSKGGFKIPGNLHGIMAQAQKLKADLEKVQEETKALTAEGSAGGGAVVAVANGKNELVSIKISSEVVGSDTEMLQDMVLAAVNQAFKKVHEAADARVKSITGGMSIPGL